MNLFFRDIGKGVPVIILHGLFGSSDNWMYIARILSKKYRIISVDCRNHGNSPHADSHSYSEMVTDLAWFFQKLEIERAHLLGHSMGGKLAIAFAADYPEKILSLTVVDIAPKNYLELPAFEIQYEMHKRILDTLYQLDYKKYSTRKDIKNEIENKIPEFFTQGLILKNLKRSGVGFEWKINVNVLRTNIDKILSDVTLKDFEDRIPMTYYPVLFIRGGLSGYIKESDFSEIRKMYPGAIIITIEGASHLLHSEKPDEFISAFLNFLSTVH